MNLVELEHALRKLRLSGMATTLDARLRQAQSEKQTPIDLVSALVTDELLRRQDRLITRRIQQARFRDTDRSLDTFDLDFNKKMNRALIHDLATGRFIPQREDVLFLGPPGTGKSHLAQAIGRAMLQRVRIPMDRTNRASTTRRETRVERTARRNWRSISRSVCWTSIAPVRPAGHRNGWT